MNWRTEALLKKAKDKYMEMKANERIVIIRAHLPNDLIEAAFEVAYEEIKEILRRRQLGIVANLPVTPRTNDGNDSGDNGRTWKMSSPPYSI